MAPIAYNTSAHRATKVAPFELVLSRSPTDLTIENNVRFSKDILSLLQTSHNIVILDDNVLEDILSIEGVVKPPEPSTSATALH